MGPWTNGQTDRRADGHLTSSLECLSPAWINIASFLQRKVFAVCERSTVQGVTKGKNVQGVQKGKIFISISGRIVLLVVSENCKAFGF